jgi:hypothetical protein
LRICATTGAGVKGRRAWRRGVGAGALIVVLGAGGAGAAQADDSVVVGQWRFDEGAGQVAVDDGPFGLDGRLGASNGVDARDPARIAGHSGGALRFDGRTFVRLPTSDQLAPATTTLEAVVRADGSPGHYRYIISRGAQECLAGSYGLYSAADGGMAFYVFDGTSYRISAAAAPADIWDGAWHHVAGVFDGGFLRLYIDGRPVGSPFAAPLTIAYALTSSDMYFGTYEGSCSLPLRGDVDGVRIWRGPLAPDYIAQLSDAWLRPPAVTPPVTPSPETVPVTPPGASDAGAPASRPPLAAIAEGTTVPAAAGGGGQQQPTPVTTTAGGAPKPAATPGAPLRACVLSPSVRRLRAGRTTLVTVRVALRKKPLKHARVVATYGTKKRRLASARTTSTGRARLRLKPSQAVPIHLAVVGRRDCTSVALMVLHGR